MSEAQPVTNIDVRVIPPRERHPQIFGALGALTAGQSLQITSDHDPRPLLYQLATNLPGVFGWEYLEQGPEVWRLDINRMEGESEGSEEEHSGCDCCCGSNH
jgi:uncharacterized protein (DUF2249 family)